MKIFELFENAPPLVAVVPGDKIGEIPAGGKISGDMPTPVTQAGPTTTNTPNTPNTNQPTGFNANAKVAPAKPGSSAITPQAVPGQSTAPNQTQNQPTDQNANGNNQNTMADMTSKIAALQATVNMMRGQLTPPPPPPK